MGGALRRRRRPSTLRACEDAQERLRAALVAVDAGIRPTVDRARVAGFLADWIDATRAHVRPRAAESYASAIRLYIAPVIGSIPQAKLQPEDIGRMVAKLTEHSLREHRRRQLEERLAAGRRWRDGHFVFTSPTGQSLDAANVTHRFQAALSVAGLPRQRFHDLRHVCATLRLEQGEELAVVSRILGHASITTTANVYGHLTDSMLGKAAERTDTILGRTPSRA